jgi:hypothetical protein
MASSLPKLQFKSVKVRLANTYEQEEYKDAMKDQTSDLLAFVRKQPTEQEDQPVTEPKIVAKSIKPMFGKPKAKELVESKTPKTLQKPKDIMIEPKSLTPEEITLPLPMAQIEKYSDTLQEHAIELLASEYENPYGDKSLNPIYPIQTRMGFQKEILKVFHRFMKSGEDIMKEPDYNACKKMGLGAQQEVEMYEYQKFIREYIRQATPYRGVLVYHGLGSGKTCTAIAAAEALLGVSRKRIIVMTPSSLRDNFIREMTFCGFRHFRLQNFWVELDGTDPTIGLFAREVLGLTPEYLKKGPAIWVPDFSQTEPNFNSLTSPQRQQITQQVIHQIKSRVTFVNYNGITSTRLKQIACATPDANGYGFFDNAVIVVDEIHNLTRLMQGTIDPYVKILPGHKRKIAYEPVKPGRWEPALCKKHVDPRRKGLTNYHRGYLFYRLLATARNSKIIGLSGTPLINFPEELGILTNVLGGYIHTSSFTVKQGNPQTKAAIEKILQDNAFVDFEEVIIQGSSISVMFTLLPEGMGKVRDKDGTLGTQQLPPTQTSPTIQEVTQEIIKLLVSMKLTINGEAVFNSEPLLPPISEDFRNNFLEENGSDLKNTVVLRKRLQGLISYYRGSKKELMPMVTKDELVRVPFSPYAQNEYMRVRGEELKVQMQMKKGPQGKLPGIGNKAGELWAQIYDLSAGKGSNSYRMSSRQACNFAFPESIVRPRPGTLEEVNNEITDDTAFLFDDGIVQADEEQIILPKDEEDENDVKLAQQEDEEIEQDTKAEALDKAKEAGDDDLMKSIEAEDKPELIGQLEAQGEEGKLVPAVEPGKTLAEVNALTAQREKELAECRSGVIKGEPYVNAIRRAKNCLEKFVGSKLRLYPIGKKTVDQVAAGVPPVPSLLMKYSPKYAAILQNVLTAPGSSLVYSQFLDMEGIGIFLITLKKNEFDPIVIEGDATLGFRFSAATVESFQKRPKRYRFLSFTGGEDSVIRSMALRVFNAKYREDETGVGSFVELPPEMSKLLVDTGFKGNTIGEICRVFCITSAGAEGLSLRNVRRVHIMEPYWNHVRTDQVKGRAVRICSHVDLDWSANPAENQRTVEVYTYCSVFDSQALIKADGTGVFPRIDQTILNQDGLNEKDAKEEGFPIPDGAKDYIVTSDEYLYALSQKKKLVLENIQNLMKTSAVDCELNVFDNQDDGLGCIRLGGNPEQYAFHPVLAKDIAITATKFQEEKQVEPIKGVRVEDATMGTKLPLAPQKAKLVEARKISFGGKKYFAIPIQEKASGTVLRYDLYDINDVYRTKRLGTSEADAQGRPTADITIL